MIGAIDKARQTLDQARPTLPEPLPTPGEPRPTPSEPHPGRSTQLTPRPTLTKPFWATSEPPRALGDPRRDSRSGRIPLLVLEAPDAGKYSPLAPDSTNTKKSGQYEGFVPVLPCHPCSKPQQYHAPSTYLPFQGNLM